MRQVLITGFLVTSITVGSAQISLTDLNQAPQKAGSAGEQITARSSVRRTSQLSPMVSYMGYSLGSDRHFGSTIVMQYSMFHSPSASLDLLGGVMLQSRNTSEPTSLEGYAPLGIRRYSASSSSTSPSYLKNIRFGLGFVGMDYTMYLSEGELRPYIGFGAMALAIPSTAGLFGTVAPDVKAGLLADFTSGLSGFVEVKHVFGLPLSFGSPATPFRDLTGVAFGLAFAPRMN